MKSQLANPNRQSLVIIACIALAGVLVMLAATRLGVGINPDSVTYLDATRNLLAGSGLSFWPGAGQELKPLTHYPPLYSSLLAMLGWLGVEISSAARWLNALLCGVNIFLVGLMVRRHATQSFWLPVLAALLMLSAPDILNYHSLAITEPLFICFALTGLLCLTVYLENQQRQFLIVAAMAMSLSVLTRYVGVVSLLTGVAVLSLSNGQKLRRRLLDALTFVMIAAAPIGLWAIRNRLSSGGATDRQLIFSPVKPRQIVSGLSTVASWLLLGKVRYDVRVLGFLIELAALVAVTTYLLKQRREVRIKNGPSLSRLVFVNTTFIIASVFFLVFAAMFIDADTVFDSRSLLPVHVTGLIVVLSLAYRLYCRSVPSAKLRITFIIVPLLFVGSYAVRGVRWLGYARSDGQGYASRAWRESPAIARLANVPAGTPIYSNGYDAIYWLTGRHALLIPEKIVHGTGRPNQRFEDEFQRMERDLREHSGVVVYFNTLSERWTLTSEAELRQRLKMLRTETLSDGSIYSVDPYLRER